MRRWFSRTPTLCDPTEPCGPISLNASWLGTMNPSSDEKAHTTSFIVSSVSFETRRPCSAGSPF
ncbi:MAG: hypothetical protein KIH06_06070 [Kiritimatiellae bacterium]|nr:hypothetical protein [Kiritimatiellia bacterium]